MFNKLIARVSNFKFQNLASLAFVFLLTLQVSCAQQAIEWLHFKPKSSDAKHKKIVLISGDEEYRSEESMPMLAKILTQKHGFETVVLFAIDPDTKQINPDYQRNIPGLHHLNDADLVIMALRFRELPDQQMKYIDDYLKKGKPIIGLRTSTHAFNYANDSKSLYKHYGYNVKEDNWQGGFGKVVLGETWINHHGDHGTEGTRVLINGIEQALKNPILTGIKDIWGPSDVYGISNKLTGATVLLYGQPTLGMEATANLNINKSTMPVAWTKEYQLPQGKKGRAFVTTMGASIDFKSKDLRRLIVNACYWSLSLENLITADLNVDVVGEFKPTMFGFGSFRKGTFPKDYQK